MNDTNIERHYVHLKVLLFKTKILLKNKINGFI